MSDWQYVAGSLDNQSDAVEQGVGIQAILTVRSGNPFVADGGDTVMAVIRSTLSGAIVPLIGDLADPGVTPSGSVLSNTVTSVPSVAALRVLGATYSTVTAAPGTGVFRTTAYVDAIVNLPPFVDSRESVYGVIDAINAAIQTAAANYVDVLHPTGVAYPNVPWLALSGTNVMQFYLPVDSAELPGDGTTSGYTTWRTTPSAYPTAVTSTATPRSATTYMGLLFNDALASLLGSFSTVPAAGALTYSPVWSPVPVVGTTAAVPNQFCKVNPAQLVASR